MAKNARFHIKSPVKNFHGRAKGGGPSHRDPPPKYATASEVRNREMGAGKSNWLPRFPAVKKLSGNLLVKKKISTKNAKFEAKTPFPIL